MNTEVKAQENNFITNEEVKNELVVAKTIFKPVSYTHLDVYKRQADEEVSVRAYPAKREYRHRQNRAVGRCLSHGRYTCLLYTSRCV